jgi:hypothetical protein
MPDARESPKRMPEERRQIAIELVRKIIDRANAPDDHPPPPLADVVISVNKPETPQKTAAPKAYPAFDTRAMPDDETEAKSYIHLPKMSFENLQRIRAQLDRAKTSAAPEPQRINDSASTNSPPTDTKPDEHKK